MSLPVDRFVEMCLAWFDPEDMESSVETLLSRLAPLYQSVEGTVGLILDCGMLMDLITEWTGDPDQPLAIGTPRLANWKPYTYRDLQRLVALLKAAAARHGIADFTVGLFVMSHGGAETTDIYSIQSTFAPRHRELFMPGTFPPNIDISQAMQADSYGYAAFPDGVPAGTPVTAFLGAQWGALSRFIGFGAFVLRDGWLGPMVYSRNSHYGPTGPKDFAEYTRWTTACVQLYRDVKAGNPDALLIGYSSALSAVAEWRVGGIDLERVIADGALDIWVDQTWGGAWQDWWSWETLGWTPQLAFCTLHQLIIERANRRRNTPCKHYNLIETWDAWEPWDTLHQVPQKLRWGMWAFSHAAALTQEGPTVPVGSYLSWADNRNGDIWSAEDVAFLTKHLNAAQTSALQLEQVYGPVMVYDRPMMEQLNAMHSGESTGECVDDHAAFIMKWGTPLLGAMSTEDFGSVSADGYVCQTVNAAARLEDVPTLLCGRADLIDPVLLAQAGVQSTGELRSAGFEDAPYQHDADDLPAFHRMRLPRHQPVAITDGAALFSTVNTPVLTQGKSGQTLFLQPPDFYEPENPLLRRCQFGTVAPYCLAARGLNNALAAAGRSYVSALPFALPVAVHLWRSAGVVHVLVGNLETGVTGDARLPREVEITLMRAHLALEAAATYRLRDIDDDAVLSPLREDERGIIFRIPVKAEGSRILQLVNAEGEAQ